MSVNAILSAGEGPGQVTKGHYIQKSHSGHKAIQFDTLGPSAEAIFRSFQRTSGQGQVKKS